MSRIPRFVKKPHFLKLIKTLFIFRSSLTPAHLPAVLQCLFLELFLKIFGNAMANTWTKGWLLKTVRCSGLKTDRYSGSRSTAGMLVLFTAGVSCSCQ